MFSAGQGVAIRTPGCLYKLDTGADRILELTIMSTMKHVKFAEDTDFTQPAPEPRPNVFGVHPDRLAAVAAASSQAQAVKKSKTKVSRIKAPVDLC